MPENDKYWFYEFIESDHDINHITKYGYNLLMLYLWFAKPAHLPVVKNILKLGCKVNQTCIYG